MKNSITLCLTMIALTGCGASRTATLSTAKGHEFTINTKGCYLLGGSVKNNSGSSSGGGTVNVIGLDSNKATVGTAAMVCLPTVPGGTAKCSVNRYSMNFRGNSSPTCDNFNSLSIYSYY